MKFYDIDSVFTFGKYEGMTIAEVYEKDPKYLKYCEENIDEFYVSPSVMRELKSMNRAINDSDLLDVNFDKMSNEEIEDFLKNTFRSISEILGEDLRQVVAKWYFCTPKLIVIERASRHCEARSSPENKLNS